MTIIRKTSLITSRKKPNNQNHLSHVELSEDDWKKYLRQDLNEFDIKQRIESLNCKLDYANDITELLKDKKFLMAEIEKNIK